MPFFATARQVVLAAALVLAPSLAAGATEDADGPATPAPGMGQRLELVDRNGRETSLAALRGGRPAIVHLWATWCAPCLAELPELAAFTGRRPDLAGSLILVSVDTAPYERVEAFLSDRLGLDLDSTRVSAGNPGLALAVTAYPSTLFLDTDGRVAARHTGAVDWSAPETERAIARHLGGS